MCGIIGYTGKRNNALETLYLGLKKLEYRGYDSCGSAVFNENGEISHWRHVGAPSEVEQVPALSSTCGIAHTRWATHGGVSLKNAHPHKSYNGKVFAVHNGVIENYYEIKDRLHSSGYVDGFGYESDTDTEVLVNLIGFHYGQGLSPSDSIKTALAEATGTYGLAILFLGEPNKIYATKRSSPLVLGVGDEEYYLASDTNALPPHIEKVSYLDDECIISMSKDQFSLRDAHGNEVDGHKKERKIKGRKNNISFGSYSCFMEKEIFEQSDSIRDTTRGRFGKDFSSIRFGGINLDKEVKRVLFLGCGTAYHAGLLGKYYIENIARIPASVEISSEYKYKNNPTEDGTLAVAISQSGETIDTLSALEEAQDKGLKTIAITNTVMSSIARQVEEGIYQRIGPEISVASTKAFTSQATLLLMLAIHIGSKKNLSSLDEINYIKQLRLLPQLIDETLLSVNGKAKKLAKIYSRCPHFTFLGRQYMYPIALEGALKVKEIAYASTHGYPSGEIKHGPIAHVESGSPCFFISPEKGLADKNISTMKEMKSRGSKIFLIRQKGQKTPTDCYDHDLELPKAKDFILPILSAIPLQLFSLYLAQELNYNVDKPRNLAKSVTVE